MAQGRSGSQRYENIVGALVFGSYATGTVGPDRDLDVMLVTTLAAGDDPGSRYARLARRLALGVPCDFIVYGSKNSRLSFAHGHSSRKPGAKHLDRCSSTRPS